MYCVKNRKNLKEKPLKRADPTMVLKLNWLQTWFTESACKDQGYKKWGAWVKFKKASSKNNLLIILFLKYVLIRWGKIAQNQEQLNIKYQLVGNAPADFLYFNFEIKDIRAISFIDRPFRSFSLDALEF